MLKIAKEVSAMQRMTVDQLRGEYADVFGEQPRSRHKDYLIKRIAWRLQANAYGDLSERARRRAQELANDADVRMKSPRNQQPTVKPKTAARKRAAVSASAGRTELNVGDVLTRKYKGRTYRVIVHPDGFEYGGETFTSLSAVAERITGSHWNGYLFFGLRKNSGGER